eukprot:444265_1
MNVNIKCKCTKQEHCCKQQKCISSFSSLKLVEITDAWSFSELHMQSLIHTLAQSLTQNVDWKFYINLIALYLENISQYCAYFHSNNNQNNSKCRQNSITLCNKWYMKYLHHVLLRIVLLGRCGSGKSTLTSKMLSGGFVEDIDPTIEDQYSKQIMVNGNNISLRIMDTAGYTVFIGAADQSSYIQRAKGHVYLLLFAINSKDEFEECINTLIEIVKDQNLHNNMHNKSHFTEKCTCVILAATKVDLICEETDEIDVMYEN